MGKSWKDALLKSGLPLEHSVANILEEEGMDQPSTFRYRRSNEDGVLKTFSVDVHAKKDFEVPEGLSLELLIECKHRTPGTKWFFMPESIASKQRPPFSQLFYSTSEICPDWQLNRDIVEDFEDEYEVCGRGTEIYGNGQVNRKSIPTALNQVRYAFSRKVAQTINLEVFHYKNTDAESSMTVLVPIVVTNSNLWRVKPGMDTTAIRQADEPEDIAEEEMLLELTRFGGRIFT